MTPSILAALHRMRDGLDPVAPDPTLGHAAVYLYETTGVAPRPTITPAPSSST